MDPFSDGRAGRRRVRAGSSSTPSTSSRGRARLLAAVGAAAVICLVVVLLIATGGSEESAGSPGSGEPRDEQAAGGRDGGAAGSGDSGVDERQRDPARADAGDGPIPDRAQDPDVRDASEDGEVQMSHEGHEDEAYVQAPEGEEEGGLAWVSDESAGAHDPLGRGADSDGLTGTERERVRFAASSYVTYAYGYTGDNVAEYRKDLANKMVVGRVEASPGIADIEAVERDIEDGGARSAAVMDRFEVREASGGEVKGVAYFTVGETYDGGGVAGEQASYAQPLNLEAYETSWKVVAADKREEVSGG